MTDNVADVASTTEAQPAALKSIDTRVMAEPAAEATPKNEPVEAPAEMPEAQASDSPEGADDAPPADSPRKGKEHRLPRWMKERLDRERQVTEARTREAMLREFHEKNPTQEAPKAATVIEEKTLEDFDFDQDAYLNHKVEVALEKRQAQQRQQDEQRKQAEAAESLKARVDAFEERAGNGAWEDIVTSPLNTDPAMKPLVDLFMGDENDLDIAHHLATNLDEAKRIAALPPLQRAREVAKLADSFSGSEVVNTPTPAPTTPKKTTNAPPPPKTVSGSGKASVDINDPKLTPEQRIAMWRSQGKP